MLYKCIICNNIYKYTDKAYYGSQQHKEQLNEQIAETKEKVDPAFQVIAIQTDNENTMRRLRQKFKEVCILLYINTILY